MPALIIDQWLSRIASLAFRKQAPCIWPIDLFLMHLAQIEIRLHPISFPFHASTLATRRCQHSNSFPQISTLSWLWTIKPQSSLPLDFFCHHYFFCHYKHPGSFSQSIPLGSHNQSKVLLCHQNSLVTLIDINKEKWANEGKIMYPPSWESSQYVIHSQVVRMI